MSDTSQPLRINQVVAFNLMRARRRKGWTQEETAGRLAVATGRTWTKATLGAAERSWDGGRPRQFDTNELLAFCRVFGQPVAYFLLPPDTVSTEQEFILGADEADALSFGDLLGYALPLSRSDEFIIAANDATKKIGMTWHPSRPEWDNMTPFVEELEEEQRIRSSPPDEVQPVDEVLDEAKQRRLRELIREAYRLQEGLPLDEPPF